MLPIECSTREAAHASAAEALKAAQQADRQQPSPAQRPAAQAHQAINQLRLAQHSSLVAQAQLSTVQAQQGSNQTVFWVFNRRPKPQKFENLTEYRSNQYGMVFFGLVLMCKVLTQASLPASL